MRHRRFRAFAALALPALGAAAGCNSLNPGLASSLGVSAVPSLPAQSGVVLVVFMNLTSVPARASLTVTNTNGGQLLLGLTALNFDPTSDLDYAIAPQNCSVGNGGGLQSIKLNDVTYASAGGPVVVPFDRPPLSTGTDLNCGNVLAVTFQGTPPNVFVNLTVY
jgi:hypothetical protein